MIEKITELTDLPQWGTGVDALYEEFVQVIAAGELPGVTLEDFHNVEKELGLR